MVTLERKSRSELSSIHLISLAETICLDGAPAEITSVSTRYTFQRSAERNPPPRRLGRSRFVTGAAINNLPNEGTRESRFHSLYPEHGLRLAVSRDYAGPSANGIIHGCR